MDAFVTMPIVSAGDRDLALQVGVGPTVNLAHAALADLGSHFIGTEADTWRQWHWGAVGMLREWT